MADVAYETNDGTLTAEEFIGLAQRVWPGEYNARLVEEALAKTINTTARRGGYLVGCVRVLTDGYLFGTVPELMVDPVFQRQGVGRRLMELAWENSPTSLFFGAQPGNEAFFRKLGYKRSLTSFGRRKPRLK